MKLGNLKTDICLALKGQLAAPAAFHTVHMILSQQGVLRPCNVFDPWVPWGEGSDWGLRVRPAPAPAVSRNLVILKSDSLEI